MTSPTQLTREEKDMQHAARLIAAAQAAAEASQRRARSDDSAGSVVFWIVALVFMGVASVAVLALFAGGVAWR